MRVMAWSLRHAARRANLAAAILTDLATHGPTGVYELTKRVGAGPARVYPALQRLEAAGRIVGEFEAEPTPDGHPARRLYRLAPR